MPGPVDAGTEQSGRVNVLLTFFRRRQQGRESA